MDRSKSILRAIAVFAALTGIVSCSLFDEYSATEVADAAKDLRVLIPAIEAGLSLAQPDIPTERALTPANLKTSGAANNWTYGTDTPAQVYTALGGTGGTVRAPAAGYYELTSGDQLYFTLTPETALGATFYRMVLYVYPAFDLVVAYTTEEYIVDAAASSGIWAWGNRTAAGNAAGWITLTTAYTDGTTGTRTVVAFTTTSGQTYAAIAVPDPNPTVTSSFTGYRYEESSSPPLTGTGTYSSHVTEQVKGKGTLVDSVQYYTETTTTAHSALTYVIKDKKRRWSEDTFIVTRMEEDTVAGTKKIRSVGEVGTAQYYIDKVDIWKDTGKINYTSTHDVYNTALPRGGDPAAADYTSIMLAEDTAGAGTFTGTMETTKGNDKTVRTLKIARDRHYRFALSLSNPSTSSRALADELEIPITRQDISSLTLDLPGISGTFDGYYEAGSLFGTISAGGKTYDVVVAEEGVAIDDRLFPY